MMLMNLGAVHYNLHSRYYTLRDKARDFSVTGDGKTGGCAAGFALPQLARISRSPAPTCGQHRTHDSFRFAPFSYPVPDTRGVHSSPAVCCLECMRSLCLLFPSASLPPREQGSSCTLAPPVDERDTPRVGQNRSAFQPVHLVCAHSSHAEELNASLYLLSHLMHQITQVHKMTCS